MNITECRYEGGCLILRTADPEARRFAYSFQPGEYQIAKAKKQRSLDANAYAWVLIDKISEAVRMPKLEVYRNTIKGIGGASDIVCVRNDAVEKLCQNWQRNGIGWQTETMPSKLDGCTNVILHYGSSSYDTKQMSVLIDRLVEDARSLGIETLPPERLAVMMNEWR